MPDLKDIPDAVRWRYAAECAATLPTLYDIAFREALGKKYDALEQEIWRELAHQVQTITHDLSLPVQDAHEIARSVQIATIILFGPEYGGETIKMSDKDAVVIVKRCPFLSHSQMLAADHEHAFTRCMALVLSAVPLLNKNYTARFVRTMCTGDRQCEIKVEKKPEPERKTGPADKKK
jgi:hypothetical protein